MLVFNLKKEWFDKIAAGKKTHEYREVKPYWKKRIYKELGLCDDDFLYMLGSVPYTACIKFVKGYNPKNGILTAVIESVSITSGLNTDLKIDKPVFDIKFRLSKRLVIK